MNRLKIHILFLLACISAGATTPVGYIIENNAQGFSFFRGAAQSSISDTTHIITGAKRSAFVDIEALEDTISPGENISFRIILKNDGNVDLRDVHIWDVMDPEPDGYTPIDTVLDTLRLSDVDTFFINHELGYDIPYGTYIYDKVYVEIDIPEVSLFRADPMKPSRAQELFLVSDYDSVFVDYEDSIGIEKFSEADTVLSINNMVFTIVVHNMGNRELEDVTVIDSLPAGFLPTGTDGGDFLFVDTTVTALDYIRWQGDIPFGGLDSLRVIGRFDTTSCDRWHTNRAYLEYGDFALNAEDSTHVLCLPLAKLDIERMDSACVMGEEVTYRIRITSLSEDTLYNLTLDNYLPVHSSYVSGGDSYDPLEKRVIWDIETLLPGVTEAYFATARINDDIPLGSYVLESCANLYWNFQDDAYKIDDKCVQCSITIPFLHIEKECYQREAAVGDILLYKIEIFNHSETSSIPSLLVYDDMPMGIEAIKGSVYLDGQQYTNWRKDDGTTIFGIQNLDVNSTATIIYQAIVGQMALEGDGINRAFAVASSPSGMSERSNEAACLVRIKPSELENGEMMIGKVFIDDDKNGYQNFGESGAPDVVIYTQDGLKIHTDPHGRFSIPKIKPGKHILRIDQTTLPPNTQPAVTTARNMLDPYSQLIDVPNSGIARASFALRRSGMWVTKEAFSASEIKVDMAADSDPILFKSVSAGIDTVLESIFFDSGSDILDENERFKLERLIKLASHFYGVELILSGHADREPVLENNRKGIANNFDMSERRIAQVREFLVQKGVDPVNISRRNHGDRFAKGLNSLQKQKDRRVDIIALLNKTAVPVAPLPMIDVTTDLNMENDEQISEILVQYELYGLTYIPGSGRYGDTRLVNPRSFDNPAWILEEPPALEPFTISVIPDSIGFFVVGPYVRLNGEVVFRDGQRADFTVAKQLQPAAADRGVQLFFADSLELPTYRAVLPHRYTNKVEYGKELLPGQVITIKIRAAATESGGMISVLDDIPDGLKYINHSARSNGREIKPMLKRGRLLWQLEIPAGHSYVDMYYKCEVTQPLALPDLSRTVEVKE